MKDQVLQFSPMILVYFNLSAPMNFHICYWQKSTLIPLLSMHVPNSKSRVVPRNPAKIQA